MGLVLGLYYKNPPYYRVGGMIGLAKMVSEFQKGVYVTNKEWYPYIGTAVAHRIKGPL